MENKPDRDGMPLITSGNSFKAARAFDVYLKATYIVTALVWRIIFYANNFEKFWVRLADYPRKYFYSGMIVRFRT
ncbi:MAG: hypothetical protein ABIR04_12945, partial [Cypionkella sp.]